MNKSLTLTIIVLAASVLIASTFALQSIQWPLTSQGTINARMGLRAFWDSQCHNEASSIDFGSLDPGSSNNYTLYLRNEGNIDIALNMMATNWDPVEAANYLSLTWNREGLLLSPGQVTSCVITLTVSSNIQNINSFSLVVTISGTG